ncbi:MAG: protein translocase subunit SecD [Burkholderiales bacterium]|nr:protein translocase subunit SecD [Burkholderiales bacterium]
MNRFPLWKNALIAIVMALGVIYTVPNLFGEVPAVQVVPARPGVKADTALMGQVEQALKAGGVSPGAVVSDERSIRVRLGSTEEQLKARDVLQQALGNQFIIALALQSASPEWMGSIRALPMYLGLDLRGGVHFLLEVDMKTALSKAIERSQNELRGSLREARVAYGGISRQGDDLTLRFKDEESRKKARALVERDFRGLSMRDDVVGEDLRLILSLTPTELKRIEEASLQQNITTLRNRVNELGVAEPIVQQQGPSRVVVQLPGVQDTAKAKDILGRTATLELRMVDEEHSDPGALAAAEAGQVPFGSDLVFERSGRPYLVKKQVYLTGENISDAQPGFDGQSGQPAVHINLDGKGARIFKQITRENVGKRMAMLLVEKGQSEVVTAPVIRTEIAGGRVQISGAMNTEEARDIALLLRAGSLAAPMEIVEERTVGPSLGADNISRGIKSTLYGFAAIVVFMVIYYLVFGAISSIALASNLFLLIALLSLLQATLTLPGIAAIALTLGMAIDANVLINERIREELRNGNSPGASIVAGYERAFGTILDSNITSLIAGLALLAFGSGPVRGFAVVHCLGILTSMFSAVLVSRGLVNLIYGRQKRISHLSIGNTDWAQRDAAA